MRMFCLTRTRSSAWNERTMTHFQCKRQVSPYEAWELGLGLDLELDLVLGLGLGL